MQKIPTLFKREFTADHKKTITQEVTDGCHWVLGFWQGHDFTDEFATVKYDGACCAIINGEIYKRYDAKQKYGKKPPEGAIPCQPAPDPITGHWPHWVKCDPNKQEDKYFLAAFDEWKSNNSGIKPECICAGTTLIKTYEAIGPHWQSNPYRLQEDILVRHGRCIIGWNFLADEKGNVTFDSLRYFLKNSVDVEPLCPDAIEGIVFWKGGKPCCKLKRTDFGFEWPLKGKGDWKNK